MRKKIFLSIIFLTVVSLNFVFAGGFEIREIGTKASSLGGAFRAVADDGTAVFWNPAGLTQISGQSVTAEAAFVQVNSAVRQNYYNSTVISGYKTVNVGQEKKWEFVPTVAYTSAINNKLKFGLGVYVQHGLGAEFDLFSDPVLYPEYPEFDWKSAGNFISIHPALAKKINDRVSVGVGFFATRGDLEQRGPTILPGALFDTALTGLNIPVDTQLKGDGWGYGGNIGVLCEVNKKFKLGLTYRSATSVKLTGETQMNAYAPGEPDAGTILSENSSSDTKIALPANLGFGIAYSPEGKSTISFDVDWTEWSSYDRSLINNDSPGVLIDSTTVLINDWKNTIKYSVGFNYEIDDNLNIYTGYYIDPSPIPDKTLTPWIGDCGTKQAIDISLGYRVKNTEITLGYEYLTSKSRIIEAQDVDGDSLIDNLPGSYTFKYNGIRAGVNVLF